MEFSFFAGVYSLDATSHQATFYLMNTSKNRNNWGVSQKALVEALPTLKKVKLSIGPNYKADKHYADNQVVHVGSWTNYSQPEASYVLATAKIFDSTAWNMLEQGTLGPISVVIHAYEVVCSLCLEPLTVDTSVKNHACFGRAGFYELVESFVFHRVDFVDVPAYPQAGILELAKSKAKTVPLELLASFYQNSNSSNEPPSFGVHQTKQTNQEIEEKKKMSQQEQNNNDNDSLTVEELQQIIAELENTIVNLKEENAYLRKQLEEANASKNQEQEEEASKEAKEAKIKLEQVTEELEKLKQASHQKIVEEVYEARAEANLVAGRTEEEKKHLAGLSEETLMILKADAKKTAAVLQAAQTSPKTRYTSSGESEDHAGLLAAVNKQRAEMGLGKVEELK